MAHPAESLQPGLRASWALCEEARADLLSALGAVPPDEWSWQPDASRWSVAHQVDHLLKAEVGTSKIVRRLIRGDFSALVRPAGAPLHDGSLAAYPYGPTTAPSFLEPAGLAADGALAQLSAAHARFFEELGRFTAGDPDALAAPDPA